MHHVPTFEEHAGFIKLEACWRGDLQATMQRVGGTPRCNPISKPIAPCSTVYGETQLRALSQACCHPTIISGGLCGDEEGEGSCITESRAE